MKKILKSRIFLVIVTALVFTGIGVFADNILASQVIYNSTTLDTALNTLYNMANGVYTSNNIISNKSQGNGESTRTTSITLNKGRYIIMTTNALSWNSTSSTSSSNDVTSTGLTCTNNCTISLLYGWYNEPHSSNMTNNSYMTSALLGRMLYVIVTEDNTEVTASCTTGHSNPSVLAQAIQISALKVD